MRKVMVFGVFDGVHEGHRHFFKEAKKFGDELIVVVADDEVVKILKGKFPKKSTEERIARLESEGEVNSVVVGDPETSSWDIIRKIHPDVVAVGYDQKNLRESLEESLSDFRWPLEIETISAHEPEKYHSSLMNS